MNSVSDYDCCDEHETTFLHGDRCPQCFVVGQRVALPETTLEGHITEVVCDWCTVTDGEGTYLGKFRSIELEIVEMDNEYATATTIRPNRRINSKRLTPERYSGRGCYRDDRAGIRGDGYCAGRAIKRCSIRII